MADATELVVAILAVALAFFFRTIMPYLNAHAKDGSVTFQMKYLVAGVVLFLTSLYTAFTTIDQLPPVVGGSLGAIFITYFLLALGVNHGGFEAIDKAKG